MAGTLRVAAFGDVVGPPGLELLESCLRTFRKERDIHLVVANGENVASGVGVTPALFKRLIAAGVDVVTTGDHIDRHRKIYDFLDKDPRIIRPANLPPAFPGRGLTRVAASNGATVAVMNLMGRLYMDLGADNPFHAADALLAECGGGVDASILDFHAEATSEKVAMGWFLDGRIGAVLGTHTHVATADEQFLPRGTAFVTDLGMTGPHASILGRQQKPIIKRFTDRSREVFAVAKGDVKAVGVIVEFGSNGRARAIERVFLPAGFRTRI